MKKKNLLFAGIMIFSLCVINQLANAQIVYTNLNPAITLSAYNSVYNLDLNNDGTADFQIANTVVNSNPKTECGGGLEWPGTPCNCKVDEKKKDNNTQIIALGINHFTTSEMGVSTFYKKIDGLYSLYFGWQ